MSTPGDFYEDDEPAAKVVAAFDRGVIARTGRTVETVTLPVRELTVSYPRGYQHPDPRMDLILREFEALTPDVELAKSVTAHWTCDGWRSNADGAFCSCGVPLADIGTVPPPQEP